MEGGRVESGRADGETRKKGGGGDEEGWGANTSNWPPWSKKLFQPPSFCLTETFYTGQLTEAGCISANAVFLSTRGWLRFIFFLPLPLYLLPYRRKLWEPVFRDNSPTCLRIRHPGPQVYEMDPFLRGRIPVVRFHGFLASLFTQTGSRIDRNLTFFWRSETLGDLGKRLNSILNRTVTSWLPNWI